MEKPNVLFILADDLGWGDLSLHGSPIRTPVIDRLACDGVELKQHYVCPMCTPTRGQLLTGMDAMRNGATAVCQGRSMMRNGLKIMPQYFAEGGYLTGMFGTWHLGDSYPHRPQDRGFQEVLRHRAWGITSLADYWGNDYFDPVLERNSKDTPYKGYCTDIYFNEAMKFKDLVKMDFSGQKFIAYVEEGEHPALKFEYSPGSDALILIGPEGDFNPEEIQLAIKNGFSTVSLGDSRLRTETAAVVACHTVALLNMK